jgi:SAM-dependent methyltransferase
MHPILARLPYIRRPFYQLDVARHQLERAVLERDAAIRERDALKSRMLNSAAWQQAKSGQAADSDSLLNRRCVYCEKDVERWTPFVIEISDFVRRVDPVGSNTMRFGCPHCGSTDRERHLRLYLEHLRALAQIQGGAVLHMAPEPNLCEVVLNHKPARYIKGDLYPSGDSIQKIDLEDIPFPDETFDMAICNHMLEHVSNPAAALRELHRVLKPGARLVCQTPYATLLTRTFEEPLLQSHDDRLFFYGQSDHLRFFGRDIERIITEAGFVGRLIPHADILPQIDPESVGVNEKEPFFDFVRPLTASA